MINRPTPRLLLISAFALTAISCGGGGGSPAVTAAGTQTNTAPANTAPANGSPPTATQTPAVPVTATVTGPTLSLKTAASANMIASVVVSQLLAPSLVTNLTSNFQGLAEPSRDNTADCAMPNSTCEMVVNIGPNVSAGDSYKSRWNEFRSGDNDLLDIKNGVSEVKILTITGNTSLPTVKSTVVQEKTESTRNTSDYAYNPITKIEKLYRVIDLTFSQKRTYAHDPKGLGVNDDVDSIDVDVTQNSTGTANAASVGFTQKSSVSCSKTQSATTSVCSKTEGTFSGSFVKLGTFNLQATMPTPLQYNGFNDPIAGSIALTQGSETVTVTFSIGANGPQVKISDATGASQTLTYGEFISLAVNLF
jgi:hypothetical protein